MSEANHLSDWLVCPQTLPGSDSSDRNSQPTHLNPHQTDAISREAFRMCLMRIDFDIVKKKTADASLN